MYLNHAASAPEDETWEYAFNEFNIPATPTSRNNKASGERVGSNSFSNILPSESASWYLVISEGCPLLELPSEWLFTSCSSFKSVPPAYMSHLTSTFATKALHSAHSKVMKPSRYRASIPASGWQPG